MKILRIGLRNYRGIEKVEIEPAPTGVTVVEGPNEIGKSSLIEALDLIFEHLDSTKREAVRLVQPADRDVGPEIEVDVETGPYCFTYFKRFVKQNETMLSISAPKPENLTGREAHDRVRQILSETMDTDLWEALCVIQGSAIEQVNLAGASSLAEALDRAAGHDVAGEREQSIYDLVHEEYNIYYTDGGSERKPLKEARESVEEARQKAAGFEKELRSLDDMVQRSAGLDREIEELRKQAAQAADNAQRRAVELEEVSKQIEQVGRLERAWKHADEREGGARKDLEARKTLVKKTQEADAAVRELEAETAANEPVLREAEEKVTNRKDERDKAQLADQEAGKILDLRGRDLEFRRAQFDLDTLTERRRRIDEVRRRMGEAGDLIERTKITDKVLESIKKTGRELERAQAQLDAGSPKVRVTALGDVTVDVDGENRGLSQGDSFEQSVGEKAAIRVPDVIEVEVEAGTSLDELIQARDRMLKKLGKLLEKAGVSDLEDADKANLARKDAERIVKEGEQTIDQDLRDLKYEEMDAKIERLKGRINSYNKERHPAPALPKDLDAAGAARKEAEKTREQTASRLKAAMQKFDGADKRYRELKEQAQKASIELQVASKGFYDLTSELKLARNHAGDEALEDAFAEARSNAREAGKLFEESRSDLAAKTPERIRELAENAKRAADRAGRDLREKEDELQRISANLELLGEKGLHDALEEARGQRVHARQHEETVTTRAGAAALLYETMSRKRDEARRAYAAPLREKIVQLGGYIFNSTFDIELDEKLAIIRRSLDGLTLPYQSLSGGAKEQLVIIVRLAAAMLVDEQEGVPLIFDDTLGHTDPNRLEGMGAMLSRAGKHCQIIILTCTPGRFTHIGDAHVIRRSGSS